MKNMLKKVCCACKNFEISKNYDCKTELKNKESSTPYFTMHIKGDFTIKPLHIAIGAALIAGTCLVASVRSAAKYKKYCKKN